MLVRRRRLIALDLRGRGGSGWGPPESYRWSYYLRDLQGVLCALEISRCALIGTSMGGTLAMLHAMAHPRQVTGLVMNDTSLGVNRAGIVRAAQRIGRAPKTFTSLSQAVAWFSAERGGISWRQRLEGACGSTATRSSSGRLGWCRRISAQGFLGLTDGLCGNSLSA